MGKIIVLSFFLLLQAQSLRAQFVCDANIQDQVRSLSEVTYWLKDSLNRIGIEELANPNAQYSFTPCKSASINLGLTEQFYWLRFTIHNKENFAQKVVWAINSWYTERFVCYRLSNGDIKEMEELPKAASNTFYLELAPGSNVFYAKILNNSRSLKPQIAAEGVYESKTVNTAIFCGLVLGVLLFTFCVNAYIAISSKRSLHAVYALLVLAYATHLCIHGGFHKLLLGMDNFLVPHTNMLSNVLFQIILIFICLYIKLLLEIKNNFIIYSLSVCVFILFFMDYYMFPLSFLLSEVFGVATLLYAISMTYQGWKIKRAGSFLALLAYSILLVFGILEIIGLHFSIYEIFPIKYLSMGYFFECCILAFAVAQKTRYDQEKLKEAKENADKENARLIAEQNTILEQRVLEKTNDLQLSNAELMASNEELYQTQEELSAQRDALEASNKQLNIFQRTITDSIRSAELIQKAILPSQDIFKNTFKDFFILYKPQHIVSGDFYWLRTISGKTFLAVGDCTGHGVRGAFMTIVASTLLDSITARGILNPGQIIKSLDTEARKTLDSAVTKNSSGMDIMLVAFEAVNNQTTACLSGAHLSLFYLPKDGKIQRLKGISSNIGDDRKADKRDFQEQTLRLKQGDKLFLTSDGFTDQNNAARKRMGSTKFIALLEDSANSSMNQQKQLLDNYLMAFMENTVQRDDICVVGLEL